MMWGAVVAATMVLVSSVSGHVGLTFPPARDYDLDFLDSFRTVLPCGMFKGKTNTLVEAGKPLEVTWHLGYPHRGGFKIELFDNQEKKLRDLTPQDKFEGTSDKNAQSYTVDIPDDLVCPNCTLRLVRQALEWGQKYRFHSCADVSVVSYGEYTNRCSGNGTPRSGGKCDCKRTYYGDQCQYKDDCVDDSDCNGHGKCLSLEGTTLPAKECFCEIGYFGQFCDKESLFKTKKIDFTSYEEVQLQGDDVKMMWRHVGTGKRDEIEVVYKVKTLSYVALGWRPSDISKSCQKFPKDAPAPRSRDFHPMDCQDIVIGKVKGSLSNVGDYYTRDRSTPRRDSYYGGNDDLTAAAGWEEDGVTTIMFRKPVTGSRDSGKADHDFNGVMRLIWAFGQDGDPFFAADELKYHGGNRGHISLKLFASGSNIGPEPLSQQRIMMLAAIGLLAFILIMQAVHKMATTCCSPSKRGSGDLDLKIM